MRLVVEEAQDHSTCMEKVRDLYGADCVVVHSFRVDDHYRVVIALETESQSKRAAAYKCGKGRRVKAQDSVWIHSSMTTWRHWGSQCTVKWQVAVITSITTHRRRRYPRLAQDC
jgi:flagellar biosynthesis GTPase FlhF